MPPDSQSAAVHQAIRVANTTHKMLSPNFHILCILCLILAALTSVTGEIRVKKGAAHVQLNHPKKQVLRGTIRLSRQERPFYAFYGVRYAKPPQRFERPEPLEENKGSKTTIVDAFAYGSSCARWSRFLKKYTGSEDCLYLNVFVPNVKGPLPVMIYIHGGAFADGESESHGPEFFMDEDVILVTINYRLGALGFLSTGDTVVPGNMALHDQALAIRWVVDNIATFGGDVDKITLFGESAGAVSTNLHMLYPPNKGLFSRAILQSGTAHTPWAIQHRDSARIHLEKLTKLVGCDDVEESSSEAVVECLRTKSWEELLEAQNKTQKWFPGLSLPFAPVIEVKHPNAFLSEDPDFLMRTGQMMNIPSIIGINEEEGYYVYSEVILKNGKMLRMLNTDFNAVGPDLYYYTKRHLRNADEGAEEAISSKIREFYFGDTEIGEKTSQGLIDLSSDRSFEVGIEHTAKVLAEGGNEHVYTYIFSFKGEHTLVASLMKEGKIVVSHADELQYFFKSQRFGSKEGFTKDGDAEKISKSFVKVWASFAKHGSPNKSSWNNVSTSKWTPLRYDKEDQEVFWYELNSEPRVVRDYHTERHEFWEQLLEEYFVNSDKAVQDYNKKNVKDKTEL